MNATTAKPFVQRLEATASATEALLLELLNDKPLENEIVRPKRLLDAMR